MAACRSDLGTRELGDNKMKLCRFGKNGYEKPGMIDSQGMLRDLSGVIPQIDQDAISPKGLAKLRKIRPESLPLIKTEPRLGVPYIGISKFVAIGLNFSDHAAEANLPIPSEPVVFMKATTSISGPYDDIVQPKGSTKLDWEVELGVVMGTKAQYVAEEKALEHVAGYTIVNDVSERAFQMATSQWDKGKGFDTAGPIGPWLVTTDEITNPQTLDMWLDVNSERMQTGSSRTMIFSVAKIVSHVSQYMTLLPGDIITTGTPPGVGLGKKPEPVFLKPGDVITLSVQGLGEQRQRVVPHNGK
jgi:2,4-diketo-3-deoxy-L-fuconate hydrolase